jgi:hypothetical protein
MARIPAELGLTADELDELMSTSWNMRVATIGPGDRINVTPLWFGWAAGRVYFFGRGQKIANLRPSRRRALVDGNEIFWGTWRNAEHRACSVSADGERPVGAVGCL